MSSSAERVAYIKSKYALRCVDGVWVAWAHGREAHFGRDRLEVVSYMRRNHGHFNFADEAGAFADIFRYAE